MLQFLSAEDFIARIGEDEALQIAGTGYDNSATGRVIDPARIERALGFADELIGGFVLARHPWLQGQVQGDMPDLLKGLAADIARYRLRDEEGNRSLITETVQTRYRDALQVLAQIQKGAVDLLRDRLEGGDLDPAELPGVGDNSARAIGPGPRAASTLEGYL